MSSDAEFIGTVICPRCHSELPTGKATCGNCGAPMEAPTISSEIVPPQESLVDKRWFVLLIIFGGAMFLGLPLLWKSRAFQWPGKIIVTLLTILYSIVVLWGFTLIMMSSIEKIRNSM